MHLVPGSLSSCPQDKWKGREIFLSLVLGVERDLGNKGVIIFLPVVHTLPSIKVEGLFISPEYYNVVRSGYEAKIIHS